MKKLLTAAVLSILLTAPVAAQTILYEIPNLEVSAARLDQHYSRSGIDCSEYSQSLQESFRNAIPKKHHDKSARLLRATRIYDYDASTSRYGYDSIKCAVIWFDYVLE